ncbi:MAG: transposase, partial [Mariprofundaceae bacterium]|nr:transposase [Mariprofundaceae bacterium]
SDKANYPQGLLSSLYQLKSKIPYDFDLVNHGNERTCALAHLKTLQANDVVVYDRGYYSYVMLYFHLQAGVHPVFRLPKNTFRKITTNEIDQVFTLSISKSTQKAIHKKHPFIIFKPIKVRLLKYTIGDSDYSLCTTLLDPIYTYDSFKDLYHARWGIEELYKVSKQMIEVEDFHGKSERAVKQELFAHFVLITMSRLCSNESENTLNSFLNMRQQEKHDNISTQVNFKNCLLTVSRHLEAFMFIPAQYIKNVMSDIVKSISRNRQTRRPNRSYIRKSMKPINKWTQCKS